MRGTPALDGGNALFVLGHLALGLLLAFTCWALAFALGASLLVGCSSDNSDDKPLDFLSATAIGMAIVMLLLFLLAVIHLLNPTALVAGLTVVLLALVRKATISQLWQEMQRSLRYTIRPAWIASLVLCVGLSGPALLPPSLFDDTMYHLAYAVDWAHAGGLVVDPYLRFPLGQFNIELLYAALLAVHADGFVQFVTWLFFAITATAITTFTSSLLRSIGTTSREADAAGFVTSCVYIACPVVLRFANVCYVDIPAGAMLLALGSAAVRARGDFPRYGLALAVVGGSFIGIKLLLAPYLLLVIALLLLFGRKEMATRKSIGVAIVVFLLFAAPWFARNLFIAGDPLDPVLNLGLHHTDPFWNQADLEGQKSDLWRPVPLLFVPLAMFFDVIFAGDQVSVSFVFFYVPFAAAIALALRPRLRRLVPDYAVITAIVLFAMADELLASNHFARYALHFYPLFLVMVAVTAFLCLRSIATRLPTPMRRYASAFALAFIVLLAAPSPSASYEYGLMQAQNQALDLAIRRPRSYLSTTRGYNEADDLSRVIAASSGDEHVLTINFPNLAYYFRKKDVVSLGDWFGPARVADLRSSIDANQAAAYLKRFNIGGVIFARDETIFNAAEEASLVATLASEQFTEITQLGSDVREFAKRRLLAAAASKGVLSVFETQNHPGSVSFEEAFARGQISHDQTTTFIPGGRSAFVFPVLFEDNYQNSITIISGFSVTFKNVRVHDDSKLSFFVAKVSTQGTPCLAWVEADDGRNKTRIYSQIVPVASSDGPKWQHVELSLPNSRSASVAITLGSSSIAGGGIGDWVGYVFPELSHATLATH